MSIGLQSVRVHVVRCSVNAHYIEDDADQPNNGNDRGEAAPLHQGTPATPMPNTVQRSSETDSVNISFPAWVLKFTEISINLTPHRTPTNIRDSDILEPTPSPSRPPPSTSQPTHASPSRIGRPSSTSQPTRASTSHIGRPSSTSQPAHASTSRTAASPPHPPANLFHVPARTLHVPTSPLHTPIESFSLRPIHPLQSGEPEPPSRTFDLSRAHGYYIVFVGPSLGIFHKYWSVPRIYNQLTGHLRVHRSDIEPYLRKGRGGGFQETGDI